MEQSIPLIVGAGWEEAYVQEIGCPYISHARATLTRRALDAGADVIVYLDYDLSWDPEDLLRLISTPGDVVAGTYRYKKDDEEYMGGWHVHPDTRPIVRADGCFKASAVPGGFLKVTRQAIDRIVAGFPELIYGDNGKDCIDLFNHGAHKGTWYGEDMAFSRRWEELGGDIWLIPDLNITHHAISRDVQGRLVHKRFPGNLHKYMLRQPQPEEVTR